MRHPRFQHPPLRPPLSLILVLGKDHGVGVVSVDIDKQIRLGMLRVACVV